VTVKDEVDIRTILRYGPGSLDRIGEMGWYS
jgi:hypothetical protein